MHIIRHLDALPAAARGGAVSIGNFDGVHRGHIEIVRRLLVRAEEVSGPAIVFTFDPHPVRLLRPDQSPPPLTWTERKAELLAAHGVDWIVAYPTDEALLQLSADEFFQRIIRNALEARALIEGPNFFFGHNREGTIDRLRQLASAANISLDIVPSVEVDGELVSSSRVRDLIRAGNVEQAKKLLAAPYRIRGMVTHGAGRGAKIGFPTANLGAIDTLLPAQGVYAGRAWVREASWPAAINLGPSPTFGDTASRVEAHLIGHDEALYGQPLEVDFLARLRDIRPFDSPHALTQQLVRDVEAVKQIASGEPTGGASPAAKLSPPVPSPQPQPRMIDWRPFVKLVNESHSFVLTSHMRPDCDAIGSELGLALALRSLGKSVRIVNGDAVPPHIAFIDPNHDIEVLGRDVTERELQCDVLAVLDTSAWGQLGPMADVVRRTSARKIIIDHHLSEDDFGATVFKDSAAEATGRLIMHAIDALGAELTLEIAMPLFTAIATDTGWFRFASVNEETFFAASRLTAAGAKPHGIFSALYEQNSLARLHLQGRILTNVKSHIGGRLLTTAITQADLQAAGAEPTDTEDVINRLLGVAGVEVALLFLEFGPHETKVSLRSRSPIDVRAIAERFGGGGHRAAAGVRFPGPLALAEPTVIDAVRDVMDESRVTGL